MFAMILRLAQRAGRASVSRTSVFRHSVVLGDLCGKAKTVQALTADFSFFLDNALDLLRLSLVILAVLDKISEGLLLGEDRHFFSV